LGGEGKALVRGGQQHAASGGVRYEGTVKTRGVRIVVRLTEGGNVSSKTGENATKAESPT